MRRRVVSCEPTRDSWLRFIPAFRDARSVVLHRYGTDPAYNAWRGSVPGQHGSILVQTSERNPPPLFGAGLIDAIPDEVIEAAAKRKSAGSAPGQGTGEPPEGWTDRPLRMEGANGDARRVRPLRRRRRDGA